MEANTINDRINLIISKLSYNKNSFSIKIGLSNSTIIGNIVSGRRNKPSYEVILKILSSFDNISADWLITGKGEMFKEKGTQRLDIVNEPSGYFAAKIDHDREIIEMQRARIETLLKLVKTQEEFIQELKKK